MVEMGQQVNDWQPTATMVTLLKRAEIIQQIRQFFIERGVTEVETPTMSRYTVTDVHLQPFQTQFVGPGAADGQTLYLMTSPEYHMKRLLAAGSGPIFQLAKAFRNEEAGRYHNPEFTLLEWYHPYYDMFQLMNEVDDLLSTVLNCQPAELCAYQQLFLQHLQVDPLLADSRELQALAKQHIDGEFIDQLTDRDSLLQLLFTMVIEPRIGKEKPIIVYHFPAAQAALAQISAEDNRVAERFEVYYQGIELANGFHELTDAQEQQRRFLADNRCRAAKQLPERQLDDYLLAALAHGLPDCSGVALGVDRLIMLALNAQNISDVLAFPVSRA